MEGSDGSPPQSLCMIRAAELFPKPQMEKEDNQLTVPFHELAGESVKYLGRTDDGVLALSNYRFFVLKSSSNSETSVPLGLIESVQTRDLFHLIINCKDASTVKCSFETAEQCSEWQRRLQLSVGVPETLESLFAFPFYSWTCDGGGNNAAPANNGTIPSGTTQNGIGGNAVGSLSMEHPAASSVCSDYSERLKRAPRFENDFMREVERLGFDLNGPWRISQANADFKLCPSYPPKILVPCCISDETLHTVANFRGSRRLPAVVWRHRKSGAVIARCSQPEVGWLGWRNSKDEQLLKALADACAFDRGEQMRRMAQVSMLGSNNFNSSSNGNAALNSGDSSPSSPDGSHEEVVMDEVRKVLIVDARSYTSAVTNRARGGGCECIEYYPCAEIEFMNLGNIHVIRKSFHALRQLCASPPDVMNWLGLLEKTGWLQHLSGLLAASMTVCHAIEKKGRPVLVHCSDGWDRTPQIVATAQLCLDPYYRTVEGFRILVEREWLHYGHKFSDRCGHGPGSDELNERCPVFLQWLDLVHQIHRQFPCSFEFSMAYLIKLAQHSLSCLFGTFFCNTLKERLENSVMERTFSVWPFLSGPMYRNPLYVAHKDKVLWPAYNVRDLSLWTEVYLGSLGNQNNTDFSTSNADGLHSGAMTLGKTRSYGDLITAGLIQNGISRRSSDPNMTVDPNLTIGSNSENNSIADIQSEREDSPDIVANFIHDATRALQNLTQELNNEEEIVSATQRAVPIASNSTTYAAAARSNGEQNYCAAVFDESDAGGADDDEGVAVVKEKAVEAEHRTALNAVDSYDQTLKNLLQHQQPLMANSCYTNGSSKHASVEHEAEAQAAQQHNNKHNITNSTTTTVNNYMQTLNNLNQKQSEAINELSSSPADNNDDDDDDDVEVRRNSSPEFAYQQYSNSHEYRHNAGCESTPTTTNTLNNAAVPNASNGYFEQHAQQPSIAQSATTSALPVANKFLDQLSNSSTNGHAEQQQLVEQLNGGITLHKMAAMSLDLMQSVDLSGDSSLYPHSTPALSNPQQNSDGLMVKSNDSAHNLWHGSVNTSTDTLVPIESSRRQSSCTNDELNSSSDHVDAVFSKHMVDGCRPSKVTNACLPLMQDSLREEARKTAINGNSNHSILPKIHSRSNMLSSNSVSSNSSGSLNNLPAGADSDLELAGGNMEESIMILPEHQKLEISFSGTIYNNFGAGINNVNAATFNSNNYNQQQQQYYYNAAATPTMPAHNGFSNGSSNSRRRRTLSSNSKRDIFPTLASIAQNAHAHNSSKLGGVRSLPMTPPGLPDRQPLAISCPDGLAHALSEQNLRLQQIVQEHKLREDVLLREIHDMRMALLRKMCPNCNNVPASANDEQCTGLENAENASICSWEAVEDRSAPSTSSCASSSIQANNAASVLWVPDHAVSRCTNCQTEFWLGRRKHHCRSCGQIFCADCSEFWAPLPDEKLFSAVRLCGPCYHSVTTRMQQQHQQQRSFMTSNELHKQQQQQLITSAPGHMELQQQQQQLLSKPSTESTIQNDNSNNMLRCFNKSQVASAVNS